CTAPTVAHSPSSGSCVEGATIALDGTCTPKCELYYTASPATVLRCTASGASAAAALTGAFTCLYPCGAPQVSNAAVNGSCAEGQYIRSGTQCTPACAPGFTPSSTTPRTCAGTAAGTATLEGFTCTSTTV